MLVCFGCSVARSDAQFVGCFRVIQFCAGQAVTAVGFNVMVHECIEIRSKQQPRLLADPQPGILINVLALEPFSNWKTTCVRNSSRHIQCDIM